MTLKAPTSKFSRNSAIIIILVLGLAFHLYKIFTGFNFDYDQQVAANASYDFFKYHKVSAIGQELSFQGFFLGPLHNWIEFIPYSVCNLKPDCVPYFFAAVGILTAFISYLILKKILGKKTSIIVTSIYTFSFVTVGWERGVNSNYFLFLSSLGILFCLFQYFKGKNKYLILGSFITGLATVNFNPVFIFSSEAFFITSLLRKKIKPKIYFFSLFAFFINYLPLALFNSRHNNLLISSLKKFSEQNVGEKDYLFKIHDLFRVSISFISNYLFESAHPIFTAFTLALLLMGVLFSLKRKDKFFLFLPIWIVLTFVGFIFYKGHIPDYYFIQILLPDIILVALALRTNLIIFLVFITTFVFSNVHHLYRYEANINYKVKKEAISYILSDTKGETFNVYYQMPPGANTGYFYIFKAYDREPIEGGKNLYILELVDPWRFNLAKYKRSFPDKSLQVKTFGFIHVVSVK